MKEYLSIGFSKVGGNTLVLTGAFLFVDWHALLVKKTLHFNFSIFK